MLTLQVKAVMKVTCLKISEHYKHMPGKVEF